jgi:hypothetical protein
MNKRLKSLALMTSLALCQPAYGNPWEFIKENKLPLAITGVCVFSASLALMDWNENKVGETQLGSSFTKFTTPPWTWRSLWASPQEVKKFAYYCLYLEMMKEISVTPEETVKKNGWFAFTEGVLDDLQKLGISPESSLTSKELFALIGKYEEEQKAAPEGTEVTLDTSLSSLKGLIRDVNRLGLEDVSISLGQSSIVSLLFLSAKLAEDDKKMKKAMDASFDGYKKVSRNIAKSKLIRAGMITLGFVPLELLLIWVYSLGSRRLFG